MGQFDIKKEVRNLMGQKFGSFYASQNALHNKYACCKGGSLENNGNFNNFRIFFENKGTFDDPSIVDYAISNSYYRNGEEKLEIKDLTTGRTYSTGWAEKLKADKFNSIMVHGYTIKDNGNGIVDENDTIEGKDLEKPMSLYEFLNPMTES